MLSFLQTIAEVAYAQGRLYVGTGGGTTTIPGGTGVQVIIRYVEALWPWFIAFGVGIVIIRMIMAGYEIMFSGGNPGLRQQGVQHILYSIVGLIMLIFAAVLLNMINPNAYT
ncbi:hypothetical protein COU77_04130 [Candidatus Peregrinibacteria bacterium CG10_big_fil_rev_8_21_14_0_10_49_16]|nr:MAG: hypothetical protein COW95_03230 [Candidatus Peregrinibacteria bacterium CG22_combo_CG10-13_8_21_14_all_49_11]PIR51723.1 MAG: hypothetical protein COU77_04130 [Candidatus Peregrinibacteria bacterium CG10_big_fil_rev_8_21_14_0_10_49_16]